MKNLLLLLLIGFFMSCGNSEDSPHKNGLTKKTTSKQKVDKTKNPSSNNEKVLVYSITGDWKVNYGDGEYGDEYSTYEIFYTETTNRYELVMEGFQPKNHNAYEEVSKLIININNAVLDGNTHKEIRTKYLQ